MDIIHVYAEKVILDKDSFKALSSDTRISILKELDGKRMTITQLSDALRMSKPALLKHMEALIDANLVKKERRERKWIYYDLTFKGKNILNPDRAKVIVLLSTAAISLVGSIIAFLTFAYQNAVAAAGDKVGGGPGTLDYGTTEAISSGAFSGDGLLLTIGVVLLVVFATLLAVGLFIRNRSKKRPII
jgi:DNA-binding transcriptional ArsR family regulator